MRTVTADTPTPARRATRSIHIGLDRVDASVFRDILEDLTAAENDAQAMRDMANDIGCATRLFLSERATRDNVLGALESAIARMVAGDFLMISFAGHGVSLRGVASEPDGWDEAWCLYDGVLLDDELHDLLALVPQDCDVVIVTDACFAGGMLDDQLRSPTGGLGRARRRQPKLMLDIAALMNPAPWGVIHVAGRPVNIGALHGSMLESAIGDVSTARPRRSPFGSVFPRSPRARDADDRIAALLRAGEIEPGRRPRSSPPPPVVARVVALAAAEEGELAYEGQKHGLFTATLVEIVDQLDIDDLTYQDLMTIAADTMVAQSPTLGTLGEERENAADARVFSGSQPDPKPGDNDKDK